MLESWSLAFLKRFQAKHALGLDPGVGAGSRQENASGLKPGAILARFSCFRTAVLGLRLGIAGGCGYTLAA
jgi:hypothetical protein